MTNCPAPPLWHSLDGSHHPSSAILDHWPSLCSNISTHQFACSLECECSVVCAVESNWPLATLLANRRALASQHLCANSPLWTSWVCGFPSTSAMEIHHVLVLFLKIMIKHLVCTIWSVSSNSFFENSDQAPCVCTVQSVCSNSHFVVLSACLSGQSHTHFIVPSTCLSGQSHPHFVVPSTCLSGQSHPHFVVYSTCLSGQSHPHFVVYSNHLSQWAEPSTFCCSLHLSQWAEPSTFCCLLHLSQWAEPSTFCCLLQPLVSVGGASQLKVKSEWAYHLHCYKQVTQESFVLQAMERVRCSRLMKQVVEGKTVMHHWLVLQLQRRGIVCDIGKIHPNDNGVPGKFSLGLASRLLVGLCTVLSS